MTIGLPRRLGYLRSQRQHTLLPNRDYPYVPRDIPSLEIPPPRERAHHTLMADLYPPTYNARVYPPANDNDDNDQPPSPTKSLSDHQPPKSEAKPQATFLTKLYA